MWSFTITDEAFRRVAARRAASTSWARTADWKAHGSELARAMASSSPEVRVTLTSGPKTSSVITVASAGGSTSSVGA